MSLAADVAGEDALRAALDAAADRLGEPGAVVCKHRRALLAAAYPAARALAYDGASATAGDRR
ncbi:hypothetical protein AB0M46_12115 [Dactylosporangium sp. NPDC051485]|uniref:hypothetical protein n=1 Tax=Dactylosporangium sp. NPDC051485 TaxID=3154846 RepID=UPI00342CBFB2